MKLLVSGLVAAAVALGGLSTANADQMRICLLKIEGDRKGVLHDQIKEMLEQPYQLFKASNFYKAAKRKRAPEHALRTYDTCFLNF